MLVNAEPTINQQNYCTLITNLYYLDKRLNNLRGRPLTNTLHCYCRVSTRVQSDEGTSIETQHEFGKLKANSLGMKVKFWNEGAASSDHEEIEKRPVLSSLVTAIADGTVKHLWVHEASRLSRTDNVSSMVRYQCFKNKVAYYVKDNVTDFTNPIDVLTLQIMDAFSQFENAIRKERSRLGKLQKVRKGFWHGGEAPYGYRLKKYSGGNKLEIEPTEASWIKQMFKWYLKEQSTFFIQKQLLTNGVLARRGGTFSQGSIQQIFRNTHHIGHYIYTDGVSEETVEVNCPRIIDDETWSKVQQGKQEVLKRKGQFNRAVKFNLLREFMWCGHCGTGIGAKIQPQQGRLYYYCSKKERNWESTYRKSVSGSNTASDDTNKPNDNALIRAVEDSRWERGKHCDMIRSLNIPITDEVVWDTVKEVVINSNVLKEKVKSEMMSDKDKHDDEIKQKLRNITTTTNRTVKDIENIESALAKIQADKVLEKISSDEFDKIKLNLENEITKQRSMLDEYRNTQTDIRNRKNWIDWVSKFKETYEQVDKLKDEDKKDYLKGVIEKIHVHYDAATNEHTLKIRFQFPIVGDEYKVIGNNEKTRNYKIIEGDQVKEVRQSFLSKFSAKKKAVKRSSLATKSVTVE